MQHKPVIVKKFVADWYEKHKDNLDYSLYLYMISVYEEVSEKNDFYYWMQKSNNPIQTIINMHQFGYEVEKEQLYTVKMKNVYHGDLGYSFVHGGYSFYSKEHNRSGIVYEFTKSKLDKAGFSGVFDNSMFEVKEVE